MESPPPLSFVENFLIILPYISLLVNIYFTIFTKYRRACEAGSDLSAAKTDLVFSETIITVSLIRFALLLKQNAKIETEAQTKEAEELEEEELEVPI